jgi:hypothetical protein
VSAAADLMLFSERGERGRGERGEGGDNAASGHLIPFFVRVSLGRKLGVGCVETHRVVRHPKGMGR